VTEMREIIREQSQNRELTGVNGPGPVTDNGSHKPLSLSEPGGIAPDPSADSKITVIDRGSDSAGASQLVLSLFPGIDLLGRGFEAEGFCIVRGPDHLWGQSIGSFHVPTGRFDGVIAGSPCQGFSLINRQPDREYSEWALDQFARVVTEAGPEWFLLENVPTVPDVAIEGYKVQRFDLNAKEIGAKQNRPRHFQFGSKSGRILVIDRDAPGFSKHPARHIEPCCLASEGNKKDRRSWPDFCELQGLPRDFDLPGWSIAFKYRAVGNGVHVDVARVIARLTKSATRSQLSVRVCACLCGRRVTGKQAMATPACRKRMERRRKCENPDFQKRR